MSNHNNYNKMYNKQEPAEFSEPVIYIDHPEAEHTVEPVVESQPEFVPGVVVGCYKLNVRENPDLNAKIVCVLNVSAEVQVSAEEFGEWFYVCTATGLEGYCMKQFIETV